MDGLVGVQPENPLAVAVREGLVSRPGEVLVPVPLYYSRPELTGERHGAVGRARVVDHRLVGEADRRGEDER